MSLLLLQAKETSEFAKVGARSEHLCDISEGDSAAQSNAGHLASPFENLGPVTGLVSQRNEVTQQENVIVAGPAAATKQNMETKKIAELTRAKKCLYLSVISPPPTY